jgi:5-methylcytosine-specific restriction endonuclease McrA
MTKRTKALDVSKAVREEVYARDSFGSPPFPCCVTCGRPGRHDASHYIKRSQGGLGVPENLINQCRDCHTEMEQGNKELLSRAKRHLMHHYPDWSEDILKYRKA